MESRRAASLRRRLMWFCIIGMFLMGLGMLGNAIELAGLPIDADPSATALNSRPAPVAPETAPGSSPLPPHTGWWGVKPSAVVLFASCTILVGVFAMGLVYTLRTKPYSESEAARLADETAGRRGKVTAGRHRLVIALSFICIAVFALEFPAEVAAQWSDLSWGSPAAMKKVTEEPELAGWRIVNSYGIFYCLACLAVPMRWRESLRIAVPGLGLMMMTLVLGLVAERRVTIGLTMWAAAYALIGTAWSAWRYADFDARLRAHALGDRYTDLHGQVSEISAELKEARKLHESLFPSPNIGDSTAPVRVDYRYQPARQIGGDFLFVHREPGSGGGATVVVIDVSGHGVAAALAVNRLHGELLRFFSHYPKVEREAGGPGHLLSDLNTYACAALAPQAIFATALVVRVDPAAGRVAWASAGHPTAFLLRSRPEGSDPVVDLASTATMLGVLTHDLFIADEQSTVMRSHDRLLAYTDGAVESRDAKGEDYTPERLRASLARPGTAALEENLLDRLLAEIEAHRHGRITDDTLLAEIAVGVVSEAGPHIEAASQPRREGASS
jgi:serine phosphatase RsbU (regulator of sigma subunit)